MMGNILGIALAIALGLAGMLFIWIIDFDMSDSKKELTIKGVITLVIGIISLSIGIPNGVAIHDRRISSYNTKLYDIVTLERASGIQGHFVLGSGNVNTYEYYCFYTVVENKGYKLEKLETEYCYIVEDDHKEPSVYKWKESGSYNENYTIYCPVGTIQLYVYGA